MGPGTEAQGVSKHVFVSIITFMLKNYLDPYYDEFHSGSNLALILDLGLFDPRYLSVIKK